MSEFSIFYLDDDEDDLMIFEEVVHSVLKDENYNLKMHLSNDGSNFLNLIDTNCTEKSVIFLDINMPVKSGFEYLEEIRSNDDRATIPVIMYSTSSNGEYIRKSQKIGANYYAVKPNNMKDLRKMVYKAINLDFETETAPPNDFIFNRLLSNI